MMIKKQVVKSKKITKLTFELPKTFEAEELQLLAEFNDWQAVPFEKLKNGKWKLIQEVEMDKRYQFRYRGVNKGDVFYLNDEDADELVPNDQGTTNAVVHS
jgi:hypothetical protein